MKTPTDCSAFKHHEHVNLIYTEHNMKFRLQIKVVLGILKTWNIGKMSYLSYDVITLHTIKFMLAKIMKDMQLTQTNIA